MFSNTAYEALYEYIGPNQSNGTSRTQKWTRHWSTHTYLQALKKG